MRPDGGPATLDELLDHYRKMAAGHHEDWVDTQQPEHRRDNALALATAYTSAANELEKVLDLMRAGLLISKGNGEIVSQSESYVNRADAIESAAGIVGPEDVEVVPE